MDGPLSNSQPNKTREMVVEIVQNQMMSSAEFYQHHHHPPANMDGYHYDKDRERETSAADAMLKLSSFQPDTVESKSLDSRPINMYASESHSPASINDISSDDGRPRSSSMSAKDRAERAFVPENKKDDHYWSKRRKNNEAAKRSREKRKMIDMATSEKVGHLVNITNELKEELHAIKEYFGLPVDKPFSAKNMQITKALQESAFYPSLKPPVPTIPLAAMASFLQQQQQLVTQAAAIGQFPNHSGNNAIDIKPLLIPTQSHMVAANAVPTTTTPTQPQMFESPTATSNSGYNSMPMHSDRSQEYEHYHYQQDISQEAGASKRRKISDSDDSDDEHALQIDERNMSSHKRENGVVSSANGFSTSSTPVYASSNGNLPANGNSNIQNLSPYHQKGLPFKMRHKHMNFNQITSHGEDDKNSESNSPEKKWFKMDNVPSVINDIDSTSEDDDNSSYMGDSDSNPKSQNCNYTDRRRRNNLAARKCRENKKMLLKMKEVQSDYLESENRKLKDDLKILSSEVQSLKVLMDDKKAAEQQGKIFVPPPLDILQKIILEKSVKH